MDVATHLLQWKDQSPEEWARAANRFLPHLVSALLIVVLAYKIAELTWTLIPDAPADAPPPVVNAPTLQPGSTASTFDFSAIATNHLFGDASLNPVPAAAVTVDAPETNLNLELRGVVSSPNAETGWAIIADSRGQEKTYFVGDTTENSGGSVLHAVYSDRVILNRAGNLETLSLPKELAQSPVTIATRSQPALPTVDNTTIRGMISDNVTRLTSIIRVVPHVEQGQMVGFRLNPGEEREMFTGLGLLPGDVVIDINGTALNDPSAGLMVFEALGEATVASVTVMRDGIPEVIAIDTSQLEGLAEGRQ